MFFRKAFFTVGFALVSAGLVHAATLYTPVVEPTGDEFVRCWISNVSEKTNVVTIQIITSNGDAYEPMEQEIAPGAAASHTSVNDPGPVYCRFDVNGNKQNFRASACRLIIADGSCIEIIPGY